MDLIKPARPDKIPWEDPCREPIYLCDTAPQTFDEIENLTISNSGDAGVPTESLSIGERYDSVSGYRNVAGRMVHPVYDLPTGCITDELCELIGSTSRAVYLRDPESRRIYRVDRSRVKLVIYRSEEVRN